MAALPFQLSYMGGAFVVSVSASEEIAPGDVLTAIEGQDPLAWLERELGPVVSRRTPLARENALASRFQTYFPRGTKIKCSFENAEGQTRQLTVKSGGYRGSDASVLALSSGGAEELLLDLPAFRATRLEGGVLWIKNLSMMDSSCWDDFCEQVLPLAGGPRGSSWTCGTTAAATAPWALGCSSPCPGRSWSGPAWSSATPCACPPTPPTPV